MSDDNATIAESASADEVAKLVMECVNESYSGKISYSQPKPEVCEITRDTRLRHELQFDSLDMVELIMAVEEELGKLPPYYNVCIPEDDCENIETVRDLVDAACRVMGVRE